jgi:hypothetical protein
MIRFTLWTFVAVVFLAYVFRNELVFLYWTRFF